MSQKQQITLVYLIYHLQGGDLRRDSATRSLEKGNVGGHKGDTSPPETIRSVWNGRILRTGREGNLSGLQAWVISQVSNWHSELGTAPPKTRSTGQELYRTVPMAGEKIILSEKFQ